ncbi:hypothetical protein Ga0076813_127314 [endosymbiont of Ridgeia piscesae]|jgi:hypothetical protein|uniref:Uncharacterized protein n=1 Tax=endosymbiont of Ridgeia piscesae TaxID=54398 RepID=A0A0T5Z566_9GAMM|nr:hypothetical protein Ga0076813_127314 [endosymbiont of Ridgeia piscesae]
MRLTKGYGAQYLRPPPRLFEKLSLATAKATSPS